MKLSGTNESLSRKKIQVQTYLKTADGRKWRHRWERALTKIQLNIFKKISLLEIGSNYLKKTVEHIFRPSDVNIKVETKRAKSKSTKISPPRNGKMVVKAEGKCFAEMVKGLNEKKGDEMY